MYVNLKLCRSASNRSESSSKTHQTSEPYISALGRWWGRSSAACYGKVAIRMKCWSTIVSCIVVYSISILTPIVPSDVPSEVFPHTLHSRHRKYHDPSDMERYVTFAEPHRIRYTAEDGACIHDQYIKIRYEFTAVATSVQFQGDVRRKDLLEFYDVDVVWTNVHGRTDSYGKVKGIGAIQRLKLWRDRYTTCHSLTVLANKTDGSYREYDVHCFEGELRGREDRAKQVRLNVQGRRGSAPEGSGRRFSIAQRMRPRVFSTGNAARPVAADVDIRHLSIQFTHSEGMCLMVQYWPSLTFSRLPALSRNLAVCAQLRPRIQRHPVSTTPL